jgi:hypothetical protein
MAKKASEGALRDGDAVDDPFPLASKPTMLDEVDELQDNKLNTVNIFEAEERIGLMCRVILEHGLRSRGKLTLKEKMDFALRTITTLEGQKNITEWREGLRKRQVAPKSTVEYQKERAKVEEKLMNILTKRKEITVEKMQTAIAQLEDEADAHAE